MNKKCIRYNKSGFTLIELVFATAILGTMLILVTTTFIGVFRFYVWAGNTRTSQAASRVVMDTITQLVTARHIQSVTGNSMCLAAASSTTGTKTLLISFDEQDATHQIFSQEFPGRDCNTTPQNTPSTKKALSPTNLRVSTLTFTEVNGAYSNGFTDPANPNNKLLHKSVIINMSVVNGQADSSGNCINGDNFCNIATYQTAATERQNNK